MWVYICFFCHAQAKAHFHVTQRRKDLHATRSELLGISNVPFTCMCQRHLSHVCVRACVHTFTHASISQWILTICGHAFCTHVYEKLVARRSFSFITTSLWATASEQENCTLCTTQEINVFAVAWKMFEKKSTAVLSLNFAMATLPWRKKCRHLPQTGSFGIIKQQPKNQLEPCSACMQVLM